MDTSESNQKAAQIKIMLEAICRSFLQELPERLDHVESLILDLENSFDRQQYDELYREVHSLKGSGGTHGIHIISMICHQLENNLTGSANDFDADNVVLLLAFVDLLRQAADQCDPGNNNFSDLEQELDRLSGSSQYQESRAILIAEPSRMMESIYQNAAKDLPVQLTIVNDGLEALQLLLKNQFDCVFVAKELKSLNGFAVVAALRASLTKSAETPVYLVCSSKEPAPDYLGIKKTVFRSPEMKGDLRALFKESLQ